MKGECFMPRKSIKTALIVCRSVTYAQRAAHILTKAGLRAAGKRLPAVLPETGCGHAVRVEFDRLQTAKDILADAGYDIGIVLCPQPDGTLGDCV